MTLELARPRFVREPGHRDPRRPASGRRAPGRRISSRTTSTLDRERRLLVVTGPNMGGKSTYMRQTAVIALLAYCGSFVPAREATLGPLDAIYTRIGAADDLAGGRSTFMVEMTEAAYILNRATPQSLVLIDEIGRGTSTFDGLALAWAIAHRLAEKQPQPRAVRDALLRAHRAARRDRRLREPAFRRGRARGRHRLPARRRGRSREPQLRAAGGEARGRARRRRSARRARTSRGSTSSTSGAKARATCSRRRRRRCSATIRDARRSARRTARGARSGRAVAARRARRAVRAEAAGGRARTLDTQRRTARVVSPRAATGAQATADNLDMQRRHSPCDLGRFRMPLVMMAVRRRARARARSPPWSPAGCRDRRIEAQPLPGELVVAVEHRLAVGDVGHAPHALLVVLARRRGSRRPRHPRGSLSSDSRRTSSRIVVAERVLRLERHRDRVADLLGVQRLLDLRKDARMPAVQVGDRLAASPRAARSRAS